MMTDRQLDTLLRQLARAYAIGDVAAWVMLEQRVDAALTARRAARRAA
jgi:hypothetical protein